MFATAKMFEDKFSIPSADPDSDKQVYAEMENFVYHLAWMSDAPGDTLMEAEEIAGELLLELVKGMKNEKYQNLSKEDRKAVLRTMLDHRFGELKHRFYGTHRKVAKLSASIEADEVCESLASDTPTPEQVQASNERVARTRELLTTEAARQVFDTVVLGQGDRLTTQMLLSMERAYSQYKNPTVRLKPHHVAEALVMSENTVIKAFAEIKRAYAEVMHG